MSYYLKGHHDSADEVDDFDEYDLTPYGGGYDIVLTYGRPLPPSDEICYPNTSSTSDNFDYDRPQYATYGEPSAYADEALDNEYKSYARPKLRPAPPSCGGEGEYGYGGGSEYARSEYGGTEPECGSGDGSEYGKNPQYEKPESEYGTIPEYEEPSSEYGSGYGGKLECESGYGQKGEYEEPSLEYESGYGNKSDPEDGRSEYGLGYGRNPESEEQGSGRKPATDEYGVEKPSYETEDDQRPSYERRDDDDDDSYARKKYGEYQSNDDDNNDDDEEKRHRYEHHRRKDYDD